METRSLILVFLGIFLIKVKSRSSLCNFESDLLNFEIEFLYLPLIKEFKKISLLICLVLSNAVFLLFSFFYLRSCIRKG